MNPLWSVKDVSMGGRRIARLDHLSVDIPAGITAVLGQSGAGKSTLLNLLVGFERPASGRIDGPFLPPIPLRPDAVESRRLRVYWSPPTHGLWPHLTVREHLSTVADGGLDVDALLDSFDLTSMADVRPGTLSLGERSRLSVVRSLASNARAIVLDEPLAHVDRSHVGKYWTAIRRHCREQKTSLVFATHSPESVLREADHVICLSQGQLSYSGGVGVLYQDPSTSELANLLGPCNWMTPADRQRWQVDLAKVHGLEIGSCIRPERLSVDEVEEGPLTVESSRFAGSFSEVDLVDSRDGARRTFVHRPASSKLKTGDMVRLSLDFLGSLVWQAALVGGMLC